jgi:hypothetical protein
MFALDRVKALAPEHPEWKSDASLNAVLADHREMLEWTGAGEGARLMMLVLHDDAEREYAYGPANGLPDTQIGAFSPSLLDEAKTRGWVVISMKRDWKRIFPPAVGTR